MGLCGIQVTLNTDSWVPSGILFPMSRILIACEESQAVVNAMRELGLEAYSCDILPCSGGHPEWHIQGDVVPVLQQEWDLIIAFPPCTHLASSGAAWFEQKRKDGRQQAGIDFFMMIANAPCERIAIENPVGVMSSMWRKPDQVIQPYQFGDPFAKRTCLWLKNLPLLIPTEIVDEGEHVRFANPKAKRMSKWYNDTWNLPREERAKARSKTFPGIAKAMANQWGILAV